jgi:hypothetical protein
MTSVDLTIEPLVKLRTAFKRQVSQNTWRGLYYKINARIQEDLEKGSFHKTNKNNDFVA